MPLQWSKQFRQSVEEGAGKRGSEPLRKVWVLIRLWKQCMASTHARKHAESPYRFRRFWFDLGSRKQQKTLIFFELSVDGDDVEVHVLGCRVDILGTNCDQCLRMAQCCFTSTETARLIRTGSPGRLSSTFTQRLNSELSVTNLLPFEERRKPVRWLTVFRDL